MDYFDRLMETEEEKPEQINAVKGFVKDDNGKVKENIDFLFPDNGNLMDDHYFSEFKEKVQVDKRFNWHLLISLIVIFILIPATFIISNLLGDRRYYIASLIIMFLAMVPFFVNFEHKKPNARELVTLAVLTAIAIISRVAFMWIQAFVPMAGFIVITAMNYGPQAGFMCGALSMLLSNIIFGQGPWTPWQMFGYGMIGFIGGLLAKPGIISSRHILRSGILTFFITAFLSSVILDSSTLFFLFNKISKASILTVYISGLPMNLLNAAASGLAVLLLSKPMTIIIDRIKLKYGIRMGF